MAESGVAVVVVPPEERNERQFGWRRRSTSSDGCQTSRSWTRKRFRSSNPMQRGSWRRSGSSSRRIRRRSIAGAMRAQKSLAIVCACRRVSPESYAAWRRRATSSMPEIPNATSRSAATTSCWHPSTARLSCATRQPGDATRRSRTSGTSCAWVMSRSGCIIPAARFASLPTCRSTSAISTCSMPT